MRLTVSLTREVADQLDAALEEGDTRITLIRETIDRELHRRARTPSPPNKRCVRRVLAPTNSEQGA